MRIKTSKIATTYREVTLEGTFRFIAPSTYSITMDKPYKGLSKVAYFRDNDRCSEENVKSRAEWELGTLYEQYQSILYDYDRYRALLSEWEEYGPRRLAKKDEAAAS